MRRTIQTVVKTYTYCYSSPLLVDMRRDVQEIFKSTPHHKQVMMFSATLSKEIRPTCKKFMQTASRADSSNEPR